jgi:hypothetical protein
MASCWVHSASQAGDQTASLFREPHLHIPDDKSLNEWTAVLAARIEATIPVDLLAEDHYEKVRSAAEGFVDGSYV